MNQKIKIVVFIILLSIIALGLWIIFKIDVNTRTKTNIELTEDKRILNQTLISMIVNDRKSPLGNNLTKIILDPDDPQIMDESWKEAYYVCIDNEHRGWIHSYSGDLVKAGLYGPYSWCLI